MKRALSIVILFILSMLFAVDIDSKVENITDQNQENTAENQSTFPVDVDRVQEVRQIKYSFEQDLARQVREKHLARKKKMEGREYQNLGKINIQALKQKDLRKKLTTFSNLKSQTLNIFGAEQVKISEELSRAVAREPVHQRKLPRISGTVESDLFFNEEQMITLSGIIKDALSGEVIANASVMAAWSADGSVTDSTDENGYYSIEIDEDHFDDCILTANKMEYDEAFGWDIEVYRPRNVLPLDGGTTDFELYETATTAGLSLIVKDDEGFSANVIPFANVTFDHPDLFYTEEISNYDGKAFAVIEPSDPTNTDECFYQASVSGYEDGEGSCVDLYGWVAGSGIGGCTVVCYPDESDDEFLFLGEFEGHHYYLSPAAVTWTDAYNFIDTLESDDDENIQFYMVTIASHEENEFVLEHTGGGVWIGFTDQYEEGNWEWVTGEEVTYTNWAADEPNNAGGIEHWAEMYVDGEWNDAENMQLSFIVEVEFDDNIGCDTDQAYTDEPTNATEGSQRGQSFTAGMSGYLTEVFLTVWPVGEPRLVIRNWVSDELENAFDGEIISGDAFAVEMPDEDHWQNMSRFEFESPAWIEEGQKYVIEVLDAEPYVHIPGEYEDGMAYVESNPEHEQDMIFKTFVCDELDDFQLTAFDILVNGEESATIVAGDDQTIQITVMFDTSGGPPYIGMLSILYDSNFNGEPDDNDFNLMEAMAGLPAVMIIDNMEDDDNPEVGVLELIFNLGDEGEPNLMTMIQNATWFFASLDPGNQSIDDVAVLNVVGSGSDFSVSGGTDPATASMIAIVFPIGNNNDEPEEFFLSVTQGDGSYHTDLPEPGEYVVVLEDFFEIHPNLFAYPPFYFVEVDGDVTGLDFSIYEYTTLVWGYVHNQDGEPINDAGVKFHYEEYPDVEITSEGFTDSDGYYELWVLGGFEYMVDSWAEGYMDYYGSVFVDDVDDFEYNIVLDEGGDHGWIEGHVWVAGEPNNISQAWVQAYNDDHWFETWTDDNGWFLFEVPPGQFWVTAGAEGYMEETIEVQVYPGEYTQADLYLFPTDDMYMVSGMAMSESGERLQGVRIRAHHPDEGWTQETQTNDMGEFEMWLSEGVYDFSARTNDYYINWIYDQEVFGNTWLDFTLTPVEEFTGSAEGMIITHGEHDPVWSIVNVFNDLYDAFALGDENGHYYIPLVDGTYTLIAAADGYQPQFVFNAFTIEGNNVVFDVHLFEEGFVGPPDIVFLGDVPNDQGRQMRVVWGPGVPGDWEYFTGFIIWRLVPEAPEILWDYVTTVGWHGIQPYSAVVPTLGDSTDQGIYWSTFMVSAHTEDPNFFLDSEPATGYSVDNLHPAIPGGVMANQTGEGIVVSWSAPVDEDFNYHRVYRHNLDSEDPADIFTTVDTFFVDASVTDGSWEYWVTAVDISGNESDPSEAVSVLLAADDELALPMEFALQQNYPNPFNPSTQVRYALPEAAHVVLGIYDMMGRKVRTLVSGVEPAGYQSVLWNATNDLGLPVSAGVYICTIQAGENRQNMKMILLK